MKTVDIITSQHVVIQYDLAGISSRAFAQALDLTTLFFYFLLVSVLIDFELDSESWHIMLEILFLTPVFFYSFICEYFFSGQTLGKKALGIKVIKESGENPEIFACFLRWSFRILDVAGTFGALAILFASSTVLEQRLGDVLAGTCVVKLGGSNVYGLKDLQSIKKKSEHEATFTNVVNFTDDDMLLVKNALERYARNNNRYHFELIEQLAEKTAQKLAVQREEAEVDFLKKVLQDYIVLTRS